MEAAARAAGGATPAPAPAGAGYARRQPEKTSLYRVVQENLATLYNTVEQGFDGGSLPAFVRAELDGYLSCGLLSRGFALLECTDCQERRLVAFSCKGAFCPSCAGRRMAQTTANLLDHVVPADTPLRQWVLTLPHELRARIAYDRRLLGGVGRRFVDSVLGWYRRRMREEGVHDGRSGAVTVVQRVSGDLKLNPHFHSALLDGVFTRQADGKLAFVPLPRLHQEDVGDVLQTARARIVSYLERQGAIAPPPEEAPPDPLCDREPVLAQLAVAAVAGLPPAGPEVRRRPIELRRGGTTAELRPAGELCMQMGGFNLSGQSHAAAGDAKGKQALLRYILRPPVAQERVQLLPDNQIRIELKRPWSDGTYAIEMDGLSLVSRLAASVPPPRQHSVIYAGVLASAAAWRPEVIPPLPPTPEPAASATGEMPPAEAPRCRHRCRYRRWAELLKLTFNIDLVCPACGKQMRLRALVRDPAGIARYLRSLGEPTLPPPRAPARAPPWHRKVTRIKPGDHLPPDEPPADLFETC